MSNSRRDEGTIYGLQSSVREKKNKIINSGIGLMVNDVLLFLEKQIRQVLRNGL